ncbi:hypothetical protein CGRA01v4_01154 [Colletotrichum graminicola]|nr:hypothetical protein CGRA01v4_01154 [Colletotrichum graminicola]
MEGGWKGKEPFRIFAGLRVAPAFNLLSRQTPTISSSSSSLFTQSTFTLHNTPNRQKCQRISFFRRILDRRYLCRETLLPVTRTLKIPQTFTTPHISPTSRTSHPAPWLPEARPLVSTWVPRTRVSLTT